MKKPEYKNFDAIIYRKSGKYPYVNEQDKSSCDILKELTGLSASAGSTVVSEKYHSAVFVDGRYKLAAKLAVDQQKFDILDHNFASIMEWIRQNIPIGMKIAYDPRFFSINLFNKIKTDLSKYQLMPINFEDVLNLHLNKRPLKIHRVKRTFSESKISSIYDIITQNKLDAYLLCDPCSISWLLNIRDFDAQFSPVVFGYLLVDKNFDAVLYLDEVYSEVINPSECVIKIKHEKDLIADLQKFSVIGIDETETAAHLYQIYQNNFRYVSNPCLLQKAIKNETEIADMKAAAKTDSAAIVRLLHWLYSYKEDNTKQNPTEIEIANKLVEFRQQYDNYVGESFQCISAADEHSAIIHYSPTPQNDTRVKNMLLLDTGGQYKYGTTDITRTICLNKPTREQKLFYTLVLKGHIALANMKFPEGTTLAQLEPFARQFLWHNSVDYPHSTSHGIGYMSSVHESLISSAHSSRGGGSVVLHPGMIISNEPGYYKNGFFGIRLENMMLVKDCLDGYLTFETISLVPFDWYLIDEHILTDIEIEWVQKYHRNIYSKINSFLPEDVMHWLVQYMRIS